MLYAHYSLISNKVMSRWPNFSFEGDPYLACPHCGEFYLNYQTMDCIQRTRYIVGSPLKINSGHRCWFYNALPRIGGAPNSQHKLIALDVSVINHDRFELLLACRKGGFTSFGLYRTFIHADIRPGRSWYGKGAKELWTGDQLSEVWSAPVRVESLELLAA